MKPASIDAAKAQAKRLRAELAADGTEVSHGKALELVAHQYGYRDWNTLHAAMGNRPPADWAVGEQVRGRYLGQPFSAEILAVEVLQPGWFRLSLQLDQPVDVVTFDSFSNFRRRLTSVVGPRGCSPARTSDGQPHLVLERVG